MQLTHLVLAHQKPAQLGALLELLTATGDRALVHVDATSDLAPFAAVVRAAGPAARLTERRHDVRWGGFGAVAATLTLLREAVEHAPADHYVLLSGTDLPIRPRRELVARLADGAVHMDCWPMPDEARAKPMSRLERFHVAPRTRDSHLGHRVNRLLARAPRRNVGRGLGGAQPHAGGQWWTMPHACAVETLAFVDRSPRFTRFFHHVAVPDEIFFQTVLRALPGPWTVRPALTHTRWAGGTGPETLTSADVPALAHVEACFARKFDLDRDPGVLDRVRRELLLQEG